MNNNIATMNKAKYKLSIAMKTYTNTLSKKIIIMFKLYIIT